MSGCWRNRALVFFLLPGLLASAQKPRLTAPPAKPNVILITIDTVRADHLGCYGYSKIHTPTLDSLAQDGILFEHATAQVPLTWPSHTAILTGTYPFQNGVQDFTGQPLDPQFHTVAQAFKNNGYSTGAVVSAFVLDRSWGLVRGFDFYDDAFSPEAFQTKDPGLIDRKAEASVTRAIDWLKRIQQKTPRRPFFLWLHLYDPHSPYDPPEPYRTEYRDHPYDGEIAYADHELGRLVAWLKSTQQYSRTLIVATSDHGESLGEHGEQEHGFFLYNPTVHVPLIVKPPAGRNGKNGRISASVETISIAPTLLHLAGIKDAIDQQFSAPGLFDKKSDPGASYSETFYPFSSFGWNPLHSLQVGHYRYIDAPRPELYDESTDPEELRDVAAQQPATVAVLKEKLKALLLAKPYAPSSSGSIPLTPESQEKLRALGYVAYRSPVSAETLASGLADPKDKIAEFNTILSAQDAFRLDHILDGEQLLAKLQQQDPKMYILPFMAGEAAARRKDWESSAREFQKCLELNPNFDQAMTGLASALSFLGKNEEARHWIAEALKINPENYRAHYQLASMEARTDPTAAIADYQRSIAIQGNFALSHRDLGMLYYEQKNYQAAAPQLAKAVELGLMDPRLLNFLGVCYERTAQYQGAIKTYKRALQIDDTLAEAHLNLGFAYDQAQRKTLAAREYQRACELKPGFCELIKNRTNQQKPQ
jgi:choline-sulfatase